MAIKIGKILGAVAEFLPFGTVAKSLVKGAGSLLLKKAAKVVGIKEEKVEELFVEAGKLAEYDHEIRLALIKEENDRRAHELAVFGRFTELDTTSQKLRARVRPLLSFSLVGLIITYGLINIIHGIFPYVMGLEFALVPPAWLKDMAIIVVKFWFVGRTAEKIVKTLKG